MRLKGKLYWWPGVQLSSDGIIIEGVRCRNQNVRIAMRMKGLYARRHFVVAYGESPQGHRRPAANARQHRSMIARDIQY